MSRPVHSTPPPFAYSQHVEFAVQLDTGSSDLWVYANTTQISLTNTTALSGGIVYGSGNCSGTIDFAEVKIGPYTIPSQGEDNTASRPSPRCSSNSDGIYLAFLNVNATGGESSLFSSGVSGILGVSFSTSTSSFVTFAIQKAFGNGTGLENSPIMNVFSQSSAAPRSYDILLSRNEDLEDNVSGAFIIGEHLDGYESVVNQPKLYKRTARRWTVELDGMTVNKIPVPFAPT